MSKLLIFLLLLLAIYLIRRALSRSDDKAAPPPARDSVKAIETVLPCARCGLLVPQTEGVEERGVFYCSREHARLGAPRPPE